MSSKTKTTATKEQATPALVPKLRFPEFRGAPEWDAKQISNVVGSVRTGKLDANAMVANGKYRFYTCAENYYKIDNYAFEGEALLIAGNGANLGYIHHYIGKFNAYQRTYVLQEFAINVLFLKYYLDRNLPARISLEKKDGNTPYIVLGTVTEMPLLAPKDEDEQQKIAECLSSVDELIAAQARKLDALKTHKKGLMQQLFPREGETQPRLRFPEFQNAGEWEEQRLDDLAHYENGKAHENDISEKGRYIVVNSKFISTEGAVRKFSNEGFCIANKGDVLMVLSDVPNGRAIAKCYFVESEDLYTVNQRICRIRPTQVNGRFLFYVLDRNSYFLDFDDGVKQTNLRKEDVVGFPLCVPPQPAEQQRIADCLTTLDDLIAAQTQKLEALKTHKKGLMQQLFPSPEEVEA